MNNLDKNLEQFKRHLNEAIDDCVLAEGLASRLFKTVMSSLESPDAAMKKRVREELNRLVNELINKWQLAQETTGLDLTEPLNMQRFLVQQGFLSAVVNKAVKQMEIDPELGVRAKQKLLRELFLTVIKMNNQELFKKRAQTAKQKEKPATSKAAQQSNSKSTKAQSKTAPLLTANDVASIEQAIEKLDDRQRSELVTNLLKQYAQARPK